MCNVMESLRFLNNIHTGLLTISDTGDVIPSIAKTWYVEDDNLTWIFNLEMMPHSIMEEGYSL